METRFKLLAAGTITLVLLGAVPSNASEYWNQAKAAIHAACASDERTLCPGLGGKGLQTCMRIRAGDISDGCFSTIQSALDNKPRDSAAGSTQIARVKHSKVSQRSIASESQPLYSQPVPRPVPQRPAHDTRMWQDLSTDQGTGAAR